MGESPSDRQAFQDDLRAQLKAKLKPRDFAPFEGEGIDMLIRMKCLSLDILRLMTNEDLMKADLPITLIRILEANKLIGKKHQGEGSSSCDERCAVGDTAPTLSLVERCFIRVACARYLMD